MTARRLATLGLLATLILCLGCPVACAQSDSGLASVSDARTISLGAPLAWLLPLGVALVAVGLSRGERANWVLVALPLSTTLSALGYALCGFAFQYGGMGLVSADPGFDRLIAEWSPLDLWLGPGWGMVGLRGFLFTPDGATSAELSLFVSELALVATATLIPLTTLHGRIPRLAELFLALLVSCLCYPLAGNWIRGGGWLATSGVTLDLGQGYADYGLSTLFLVGGCAALAGLAAFKRQGLATAEATIPELPPAHLPLHLLMGAFLALLGWFAVVLGQGSTSAAPSGPALLYNALAAVAGATLGTLCYGWLIRGRADPGLTGRGVVAALVAIGAGLAFVPSWAALLIGGVVGLLLAPVIYLVERVLGLDDQGAAVGLYGFSALWGLLAAGLFADGRNGAVWNSALGASTPQAAKGVVGALGGAANVGQLYAQLVGAGAILLLCWLLPWAAMSLLARAYVLPSTLRERAEARSLVLEERARERARLRKASPTLVQRLRTSALRRTAAAKVRLSRRPRPFLKRRPSSDSAGSAGK